MDRKLLFFRVKEYIKYRLRAKDEHGIHSPFLFSLYNELMKIEEDNKDLYFAENFREQLLSNDEFVSRDGRNIPISEEVENSAMPETQIQFIYKLIRKFKPDNVVELGTNVGLSSLHMALALRGFPNAHVYSIEKNKDLYDKAIVNHAMLRHGFIGLPEVNFINGDFNDKLPELLQKLPSIDLLLVDGDHKGESLLKYFNWCVEKISDKSIFVFDDIYWSPDMLEAWKKIIQHPKVTSSLDMYYLGVVFFDPKFSKEHFSLKWTEHKNLDI